MTTNVRASRPKGDAKIARAFHARLARWYAAHHRDLPWRREPTPYRVTVSEFMCQQTQIATVLPYYARWMNRFPDWRALAAADADAVLKHWEGLGYYHRARNLHRLARLIVSERGGELPADNRALRQLPGIGPYIAAAIASIVSGERVAALDGNVERVLTRVFALPWDVTLPLTKQRLRQLATELLPAQNCGDHNQAMMELGALVCTPRHPQCRRCPLTVICRGKTRPEQFPVKTRPLTVREQQTIAVITSGGKIWLLNPGEPGRWHGFHRLPLLEETCMTRIAPLTVIRYSITRYRVTAAAVSAKFTRAAPDHGGWLPLSALEKISLPAPHRKILATVHPVISI
ncbi:MAG: A/G-specific adenine glycosylase [Verrucomicrobiales bacterium]|jgi:A/G-specific adenine glycosylase|nr:A/G-specific adenine glycosylase [Verrucomicrobiales bacterium]